MKRLVPIVMALAATTACSPAVTTTPQEREKIAAARSAVIDTVPFREHSPCLEEWMGPIYFGDQVMGVGVRKGTCTGYGTDPSRDGSVYLIAWSGLFSEFKATIDSDGSISKCHTINIDLSCTPEGVEEVLQTIADYHE